MFVTGSLLQFRIRMFLPHWDAHWHPTITGRSQLQLDIRIDRLGFHLHRVSGYDARSQGARETP